MCLVRVFPYLKRRANEGGGSISSARGDTAWSPSTPVIVVEDVKKSYGDVQALDGVSLQVPQGTVTGLLGPNGAGKTTLVRILTTLLSPDSGRAKVMNLDVVEDAQKLRSLIGLAGQSTAVDEYLTGRESLELVGRLYHMGARESRSRARELLDQFDLNESADRRSSTYSGGMRRRLDLAASLVANPPVLFLDEPTTGLDPRSRLDLWNVIMDLVKEGTTVLLTTQYMEEADRLADNIVVLDRGGIIAEGTATELKTTAGSENLTIQLVDRSQVSDAIEAIGRAGCENPQTEEEIGRITVMVRDGSAVLGAVVRELDKASIQFSDLSLGEPTLDDVFLALTGKTAENIEAGNAGENVPV